MPAALSLGGLNFVIFHIQGGVNSSQHLDGRPLGKPWVLQEIIRVVQKAAFFSWPQYVTLCLYRCFGMLSHPPEENTSTRRMIVATVVPITTELSINTGISANVTFFWHSQILNILLVSLRKLLQAAVFSKLCMMLAASCFSGMFVMFWACLRWVFLSLAAR